MLKIRGLRLQTGLLFAGLALFILLTLAAVDGLAFLAYRVLRLPASSAFWRYFVSMLGMYGIALPVSLLLIRRVPADRPERHRISGREFFICFAAAVALMYLGSLAGSWAEDLMESLTGLHSDNTVSLLVEKAPIWVNVLFTMLIAPFFEELIFRRLLCDRLARFGDLPAILLSGLAFGLFHGNLYQFFYAAAIGMVLAYLYLSTGSLLTTACLHMALNSLSTLVLPVTELIAGKETMEILSELSWNDPNLSRALAGHLPQALFYFAVSACILMLGLMGLALLWAVRGRIRLRPGRLELSAGSAAAILLLNPGTIFFVLACLWQFVRGFLF